MERRAARIVLVGGAELAGLMFHADSGGEDAFWVLHLHGNADSAFSQWQFRHCEALRIAGFNVLEIDYRGFGATPGQPSEAGMNEDAEAAYQALLQRGVAADHIILPSDDGFGGHVDALYEHVDMLQAALAGLVPAVASVSKP
jgi:pimeloyl-ACP methyl ester carboxylesterase